MDEKEKTKPKSPTKRKRKYKKKPPSKKQQVQALKQWELIPYVDYLTDPRKQQVANILAYSGYRGDGKIMGAISLAARQVGVNRATIYAWLKDPLLITAIQEQAREMIASCVESMHKQALRGSYHATAFLLERLEPHQYSAQHQKFLHEKEMLKLEQQKALTPGLQAPTIIIEAPNPTPDYDRNKLDDE